MDNKIKKGGKVFVNSDEVNLVTLESTTSNNRPVGKKNVEVDKKSSFKVPTIDSDSVKMQVLDLVFSVMFSVLLTFFYRIQKM